MNHALTIHLVQPMVQQGVEAGQARTPNQEDGEKQQ